MVRRRIGAVNWPSSARDVPAAKGKQNISRQEPRTNRGVASDEATAEITRRQKEVRASIENQHVDPRVQILKQDADGLITAAVMRMVEAHGIGVETAILTLLGRLMVQMNSRHGKLRKYELLQNLQGTSLGEKVKQAQKRKLDKR